MVIVKNIAVFDVDNCSNCSYCILNLTKFDRNKIYYFVLSLYKIKGYLMIFIVA